MGCRKIRDEAEARACIAKVGESGLSSAAWARSVGIDARSLHAWTVNLARGDRGARAPTRPVRRQRRPKLVELVPRGSVPVQPQSYVVRIGNLAVEVGGHFDATVLRRLIEALRSC